MDLSLKNFYESELVQQFMPSPENPYYDQHKIKVPFRMIICGSSGTMKTNALLNLISIMPETFNKVILFVACADEPFYNSLKVMLNDQLIIYEGLEDLLTQDINKMFKQAEDEACLVIFDDLCNESKKLQKPVEKLFMRGRKLNCSMVYICQDWSTTPLLIRNNSNYTILKKMSDDDAVKRIMKKTNLCGLNNDQLMSVYNYANNELIDFLFIDNDSLDEKTKFRKNFDEFLNMDYFRNI